jgi:hypothetical protein
VAGRRRKRAQPAEPAEVDATARLPRLVAASSAPAAVPVAARARSGPDRGARGPDAERGGGPGAAADPAAEAPRPRLSSLPVASLLPAPEPARLPPREPASKAMIAHPFLVGDQLLDRLQPCLPPGGLSAASSSAVFVEVTAPGIDKAFALRSLCGQIGIDRAEVVAFGDQLNDLSMLRWAGRGVAMANAHPRVLEATAERAGSNVDDGVAAVIDTLISSV